MTDNNFTTDKPIVIYTWKSTKLKQNHPKIIIKSMSDNTHDLNYDPNENAKQLARLFALSLPGNTLDVFYAHLVSNIKAMIESDNADMLLAPYDLTNRIRVGINELLEDTNHD